MEVTSRKFFLLLIFASLVFFVFISFFNKQTSVQVIETIITEKQSEPDQDDSLISLIFTGDVMLGRSVMAETAKVNDVNYPFLKVADKLKSADLVFVNLENPIINNCPAHIGGFKFCSPPTSVDALKNAGINVVTLANNHSSNYGEDGVEQTVSLLEKNGIAVTGLGNLAIRQIKGVKFGFLGFDKSQQTAPVLSKSEIELITSSDKEVDVLIVAMHWGVEYQSTALPGVKKLARELVVNGADAVVGHHPHWVQDFEYIDGKPVYYSLGNFVFDQMWSEETKKGMVVSLTYDQSEIKKEEISYTYIRYLGQPEFVNN